MNYIVIEVIIIIVDLRYPSGTCFDQYGKRNKSRIPPFVMEIKL